MLLGGDAGIGAGRVDERDDREAEPLRDLHHAHRLGVALRAAASRTGARARSFDVAALLVADERDRAAVELPEPGDDRAVVGAAAVAVQLDPVVEDPLDVVERVRPLRVPRELDERPDLVLGRVRARDRVELLLEPLLLAARRRCGGGAAGSVSRPSRSRSPRSASPLKEPEEPRQVRALLGSGDDGVDLAEAEVLLGAAEVVGELLLDDAPGRRAGR